MKSHRRMPMMGCLVAGLLALGLSDGTALAQGAPPAATAQTVTPVAVDREALLRDIRAIATQLSVAQKELRAQPALAKKVKPRIDAAEQALKALELSLAGAPLIEGTSVVVTGGAGVGGAGAAVVAGPGGGHAAVGGAGVRPNNGYPAAGVSGGVVAGPGGASVHAGSVSGPGGGAAVGAVVVPPAGAGGPVVVVGSQSAGNGAGANVSVGGMGANVNVTGVYEGTSGNPVAVPAGVMVVQASPPAGAPGTYQAPAPGVEVRRAVDSARLQEISAAISAESFGKGQLQVLQSAAASHYFTVDQLKGLLELFSFENEKLDAVAIVAPRLLDPENGYKLYGAFSFQSSKDKVAALLRR